MKGLKTVFFDLETMSIGDNIGADNGYLLCGVLKERGKKARLYSNWGTTPIYDDRELVRTIIEELSKADVLIGWNSLDFDVRYLNGRAFMHGIEPLSDVSHKDALLTSRWRFRFNSNRLENVAKMLGEFDPKFRARKIPLPLWTWVKATSGDRESYKAIEARCIQDVVVLENLWERMEKYSRSLPTLAPAITAKTAKQPTAWKCVKCGSEKLKNNGKKYNAASIKFRVKCECGYEKTYNYPHPGNK